MEKKYLKASLKVNGSIKLPGSKSITNRVFLMAALCEKDTIIKGALESEDTSYMLDAFKVLGVNYEKLNGDYLIKGVGHNFLCKNADLFLGNAGTVFRPLTAVLSMMNGEYRLSGTSRMHERPIAHLVESLRQMGAIIKYDNYEGYPPVTIKNSNINFDKPINIKGNISSQFLTALLISGPLAQQHLIIKINGDLISKPYINISLRLLEIYGIKYINNNWSTFELNRPAKYTSPKEVYVEGDASSASYFFAAGAIRGKVEVFGINKLSIQGDLKFLDIIKKMGASITYKKNSIIVSNKDILKGMDIDCKEIPDAAMTLAIIALFSKGKTKLINIGSWRVKETDRISAMKNELKKLGAKVSSTKNSISIEPPLEINNNVEIKTYDDHRIAMCFSLISLANKNITITDPNCVRKTYPNFFKDFESVIVR
jgi:3-phosphoshikimate 1-carboxyvinyltransferase